MCDSVDKGEGRMGDAAPQGSSLSPGIWLIPRANTLKCAEERIGTITLTPTRSSNRTRRVPSRSLPKRLVSLIRFVDDVNPLIITNDRI